MRLILALISTLLILSACSKPASNSNKLLTGAIMNGVAVNEDDSITQSIVAVYNTRSKFLCTGSLIGANIVLTAAHCAPQNPNQVKVIFGTDVDSILNARELDIKEEYALSATDIKVHPKWNPKNETEEFNTSDIALLKFKGVLPRGYRPAQFLTDESALKIGASVVVSGYGVDTVDTTEIEPRKHPRLEQQINNGEAYCEDDNNGNHVTCYKIESSGDGLLRVTEAPIGFIHDNEIQLNERKSGTCRGDSGGPAYIKKDGEYFLFGVTSRGSELCNAIGIYTNALHYKKWIDETIPLLK